MPTKYTAYTGAIASILTTQLNSLANNANSALSAAIDNTTALDIYCDLTLTIATQASARTAGAIVSVFLVQALDGTNYDAVHETTAERVATFTLDAAVTARQLSRRFISPPPGLCGLFVRNGTGQAFPASGNILEIRFYSLAST